MKLDLFQIDAFTDKLFKGNPASVILLDEWLDDELMQNIAMENNLAETAFICPSFAAPEVSPKHGGGVLEGAVDFDIRWFTPAVEMDLCGHATLASAHVLFNIMNFHKKKITLRSKSGILEVRKEGDTLWMDFPSWKPQRFHDYPEELQPALAGSEIVGVYNNRDLLVELIDEEAVRKCKPDLALIHKTGYNVIITAPGKKVDFVSRFFAPVVGINEDPVTGSAHSQLIPFWAEKLDKQKLSAHQLSKRGGELLCEQSGDRVMIGGNCVFYMKGEIEI